MAVDLAACSCTSEHADLRQLYLHANLLTNHSAAYLAAAALLSGEGLRNLSRLTLPEILAFQYRPDWEDLLSASPFGGYSISKALLNTLVRRVMLFQREFMDQHDVLIALVCPGWCRTAMGGKNAPRSAEKGAETPAHLATVPKGYPNGLLYRDLRGIAW